MTMMAKISTPRLGGQQLELALFQFAADAWAGMGKSPHVVQDGSEDLARLRQFQGWPADFFCRSLRPRCRSCAPARLPAVACGNGCVGSQFGLQVGRNTSPGSRG